jgi:AraC family transcriptional regulator
MTPIIERINEKKLVGIKLSISYADYKIGELWSSFMPRQKAILNKLTNNFISMAIYKADYFLSFHPTNKFERWACVEVSAFQDVPDQLETFVLPSGLYAIFKYRGNSTEIDGFYQRIFTDWLPNTPYELDARPHMEILGEKYKNNDPLSEEDICIPIKQK